MKGGQLTVAQSVAYAAPVVPMAILHAPALSILPGLYVKHTSVSLGMMGLLLIGSRLFDALTDPLIGALSDRSSSRIGRRAPFMIAGALLAVIGTWFWFRPDPSAGWQWYLLASLTVSLGWTLVEVPHGAWLNDLTGSYDERSRLVSVRVAAAFLGHLLFISAPLWPIFATTEMTLEVTSAVAWAMVVLIPATIAYAILRVPHQRVPPMLAQRATLRTFARAVVRNRPFRSLAFIVGATNLANGMVGGLYFFYIDSYLHILDKIAWLGLLVTLASLLSTSIWPLVVGRWQKHRALALSQLATALTLVAMFYIPPGPLAFPLLTTLFALLALTSAGNQICTTAMNADVVDHDELVTGVNKAGNYFGLTAFMQKAGLGLGGGLSIILAGQLGFDPARDNDAAGMSGFFVAMLGIPMLVNIAAAASSWTFQIDRERHHSIQLALNAMRERASR